MEPIPGGSWGLRKPEFKVVVEQRIGLVMYGGISLAIYMNGVAQEFLNLVLSTAHDDDDYGLLVELPSASQLAEQNAEIRQRNKDAKAADPNAKMEPEVTEESLLNGRKQLSGIQKVYREMARRMKSGEDTGYIQTKFAVDILSGTSAGGLNAMFLGKAIAEKVELKPLQDLWVQEGDVGVLLDDKESYKGLFGLPKKPARSLLSSRRMYAKLVMAFSQMENQPLFTGVPNDVDLCTEMDVYMTATDIKGRAIPIYLGARDFTPHIVEKQGVKSMNGFARIQLEAEHRSVFHFRFESGEYCQHVRQTKSCDTEPDVNETPPEQPEKIDSPRNDFSREFVPFLAFVGRCTSSIVPAFEPMRLKDAEDVLKALGLNYNYSTDTWKHLFRQYWRDALLYDANANLRAKREEFELRCFGDGGYLDNKPFGYAFKELSNRLANVAVRRNVFYVEPHPIDNKQVAQATKQTDATVPNVVEHAKAALSLPSVQSISERVIAIRNQGEYADRVRRVISATEGTIPSDEDVAMDTVARSINCERTLDMLANILVDLLGFDADTELRPALRHLVYAALEHKYGVPDAQNPVAKTITPEKVDQILEDFNLPRIRRMVEFLRIALENVVVGKAYESPTTGPDMTKAYMAQNKALIAMDTEEGHDTAKDLGREFFHLTNPYVIFNRISKAMDLMRERVNASSVEQLVIDKKLVEIGLNCHEQELMENLMKLQVRISELVYIMGAKRSSTASDGGVDSLRRQRAREILGFVEFPPERAKEIAEKFPDDVPIRKGRGGFSDNILESTKNLLHLPALKNRIEDWAKGNSLENKLKQFAIRDNTEFPLLYPAGLGDSYALDIVRISPKDAESLEPAVIDTNDEDKRVNKLSGVGMAHFGAFFTRAGRVMDIIWGRLDAAEIILRTYMDNKSDFEELLTRAQLAILGEAIIEFAKEIEDDKQESGRMNKTSLETRLQTLVGVVIEKRQVDMEVTR